MPVYNTQPSPVAIYGGDQVLLFGTQAPFAANPTGESITPAVASIALSMPTDTGLANDLRTIAIELQFSGAPGALSIQAQDADTDTANAYQAIPNLPPITAVDANNRARQEITFTARFFRLNVATFANSGSVTIIARATN